ncbi:M10 family metallopeptidase C-terminal domain-containing protein [Alphaproteobacteria bacterium LSUCC0684]
MAFSSFHQLSSLFPDPARSLDLKKQLYSTTMLWTMAGFALTACGGGGGGGGGSRRPTLIKEGVVYDGPIVGARVFLDVDNNGRESESDILIGTTDGNGQFSGHVPEEHAKSPLIAVLNGATDIGDTNGDFQVEGTWRAPPGSTVISPLTELLIVARDETGLLFDELGIPETIDVTKFNPYSSQAQEVAGHAKVRMAAEQVAGILAKGERNLVSDLKKDLDDKPSDMVLSARSITLDEDVVTTAQQLADITFEDDALGTNTATVNTVEVGGKVLFEMRSGTQLWLKAGVSLDYETATTHVVTITPSVSGTGSAPAPQTFTLNVTDVDELPVFDAASYVFTLAENEDGRGGGRAVVVGTVTASEEDTGDNPLTYRFADGTDSAGDFRIDASTGDISYAGSGEDFEGATTSYDLTVEAVPATSGKGTQTAAVTVTVTNVDEAPSAMTLGASTLTLAEGVTTARKLADISFTDDGLGTNTAVVDDTTLFEIRDSDTVGVRELWLKAGVSLDYETATSHAVTITPSVSGSGSAPAAQTFTLNVTDITFGIELEEVASTLSETSSTTALKMAEINITNDATPGELMEFVSDSRFEVRGDMTNGYALWLKAGEKFDYEQDNGIDLIVTMQGRTDGVAILKTADYFVGIENEIEPAERNDDKSEANPYLKDTTDDPRIKWIIDDGYYWTDTQGKGVEITYSFFDKDQTPDSGVLTPDTLHVPSDALKEKVRESLALFEQVSLLTFTEVQDDKKNTLRIGVSEDENTKVAFAWLPGTGFNAGNVWLNGDDAAFNKDDNLLDGSYHTIAILHEVGHALGYTHSQDTYGGRQLRLLGHEHNTRSYTIMAYNEAWNDSVDKYISNRTHGPTTLMINDIAALQYVYGTNETWARDDTVYNLHERDVLHETIWDTGGEDTISWEAGITSARINLNAGSFSSFGEVTGPESPLLGIRNGFSSGSGLVAIALGVDIENAKGGLGDDTLTSNALANILDGGEGHDTASYHSSPEGVTVSLGETIDGEGFAVGHSGGDAAGDRLIRIEEIEGSSFDDKLTGDDGDNTLIGGAGGDDLDGGAGHDIASYHSSPEGVTVSLGETIDGDGFAVGHSGGDAAGDRLIRIEGVEGSTFDDKLTGDDGDNTLIGGAGGDDLDGGEGYDIASYHSSPEGVTVSLGEMIDGDGFAVGHSGGDAAGDRLIRIEGIIGTRYDDTLEGDDRVNTLNGGEGSDHLEGGGGADVIDGGEGQDYVRYTNSPAGVTVSLNGPEDSEGYIIGHEGGDAAGDRLRGIERIWGSDFDDRLTGDAGINRINGGAGADVIDGGAGNDMSIYWHSTEAVTVDLAGPVDADGYTIGHQGGEAQGDRLKGIENLAGSAHDDLLSGNAEDNVINGGDGADIINGRGGVDTASYILSKSGVTIRLDELDVDGFAYNNEGGAAERDRLKSIENLYGSDMDDILIGSNVANTLWGLGGDDYLEGGVGADTLDGGDGVDEVSYQRSASGVVVSLSVSETLKITMDADGYLVGHSNTIPGGEAAGDRLKNIERLSGSNFVDTLTGSNEDNILWGLNGDDTISGLDGDDWIIGGAGADWILGGEGIDGASYINSDEGVTVSLEEKDAAGFSTGHTGGTAQGDQLQHIESLEGSIYDDKLTGDDGENWIYGLSGDDTLKGLDGVDWLNGGDGADDLDGGGGVDYVSYYHSSEGVTVNLAGTKDKDDYIVGHSGGHAAGDRLKSIEHLYGSNMDDTLTGDGRENRIRGYDGNDTLYGGNGKDDLFGGAGDDTLNGGNSSDALFGDAGDDILYGDAGHDHLYGDGGRNVLTGGSGADQFVITSVATAIADANVITDFSLSDKDGLTFLAEIRSIWLDQRNAVVTRETTNDANVKDTVIYTDQALTEILVVLEDFTGMLKDNIGDTTVELNVV